MANKDDIAKIEDRIASLNVKVDGIQNTLDLETTIRTDQKLPARVSAIESHLGVPRNIAA